MTGSIPVFFIFGWKYISQHSLSETRSLSASFVLAGSLSAFTLIDGKSFPLLPYWQEVSQNSLLLTGSLSASYFFRIGWKSLSILSHSLEVSQLFWYWLEVSKHSLSLLGSLPAFSH